jgi:hypothetical protein
MARFHIHLRDGDETIFDEEGVDLPDLSAAIREAELGARELLADAVRLDRDEVPDALVIADQNGRVLHTLKLADVLPPWWKKPPPG